jgi:outer membrane protein
MLKRIALLLLLVAPMSLFAQKFAHFKSMDIIPVMPEYAKAQTDIQALQKQYEDEIKRASDEFSKKFAEYQQEQKTLPQNIQERRQKELQEMQEKGIQFQQEAQQQLQKAYTDMMDPIYKKLEDAVKAIGAAGGYTYVFDLNRTDIPYIDENVSKDVTNDIKTKLGISLTAVPATPAASATTTPVN